MRTQTPAGAIGTRSDTALPTVPWPVRAWTGHSGALEMDGHVPQANGDACLPVSPEAAGPGGRTSACVVPPRAVYGYSG